MMDIRHSDSTSTIKETKTLCRPDPPKDIRIDVIGKIAKFSWIIPSNQGVSWSRIYLNDSKEGGVDLDYGRISKSKDIRFPTSSFDIDNLKMCSEYTVGIQCIRGSQHSEFTSQKFWMTNYTFTADIKENVALSWTTKLTDIFKVMSPIVSSIIYEVQFYSIISNSAMEKYIFDVMTKNLSAINITVIRVNRADAGLYSTETYWRRENIVDGCCLLIVTSKPINTTLTLQPEHPFVGDNITFTCSSTIQRWPEGYGTSRLSYQFHGNTRGATDNNKLQIHKLTKSDKGTNIKFQATDNLGKVSNMSNTVTLDPYYGPEKVMLEPAYTVINVTEGSTLGPIHCNATCNPKCKPRNVTTRSRKIGIKVNTRENIVIHVVSFPAPTVEWLRVTGFDWTVQKDRYDYRYKINSTIYIKSEKDFGEYRLKICNNLDCIGESITLTPEDRPEAPQNVSLEATSFRSVNLSWIAGFNGGHRQIFSIQFKTKDDGKWNKKVVHTNETRTESKVHYTLDQLKPDTSYKIIVFSTNKHGQRHASLEFKTKVEPILSPCAPSNSASISHLTVGLGCGIPPLLVVIIILVFIGRKNKDSNKDLKEKIVKSDKSDEYTVIQRSNPTFTEAYSTLQSPTESTALQADSLETDTYDECGVLADVEVYQTMDNRKSGDIRDEQGSGKTYIVLK
ncbi:unnamed protein product [Mytilus coruscus]|uniref:Uncharacterized protein n=1 Tax=Mytilus coruscus TaxID=42192 RepID=A0A6J8EU64_MYTCO|nr:unnamed protein product [Mytilus coruscus]